jgi:hypothetical protein
MPSADDMEMAPFEVECVGCGLPRLTTTRSSGQTDTGHCTYCLSVGWVLPPTPEQPEQRILESTSRT